MKMIDQNIFLRLSFFLGTFAQLFSPFQLSGSGLHSKVMPPKCVNGKNYVNSIYCGGRLGNQLFQIAAALSVAIDHDAEAVFPDYARWKKYGVDINLEHIFPNINTLKPKYKAEFRYVENMDFHFQPVPYQPNMELKGYFQSEKFFKHNADKILSYFKPSDTILIYLNTKYAQLIGQQNVVGVHVRAYLEEDSSYDKMFTILDLNYYEQAASYFPEETLFVIFTDHLEWTKNLLKDFSKPHIFIEEEEYYHDFYLMSLLEHQIISNSSFSWWAAYLNQNPDKIVIAPTPWFHTNHHLSSDHVVPDNWKKIQVQ